MIKRNSYRDSVFLMRIRHGIQIDGIDDVALVVGTVANKRSLANAGLANPDELRSATANDIIIAVRGISEGIERSALDYCSKMLDQKTADKRPSSTVVRTFESALKMLPDASLAMISIPGSFVKKVGMKALQNGLNLFIFSSNVPINDEVELKRYARENGLLVMGPDCGTAVIDGLCLGFANKVRRGPIGIVGASGTGIQEVITQIHHSGLGISHAIGTGSNDIRDCVGAITMIDGMRRLDQDEETRAIVLVSKPPEPSVENEIISFARTCHKPIIANFLGLEPSKMQAAGIIPARTLEDAAGEAIKALGFKPQRKGSDSGLESEIKSAASKLVRGQKFIRGVFSGGTFAIESAMLIAESLGRVYSNTSLLASLRLTDPKRSVEHTCVDMGDEEFTLGKPHPMIDPLMRSERILAEAGDAETAVLLLDCVLGLGVHRSPGSLLSSQITNARSAARDQGRYLPVILSVCGTDEDPQNRSHQVEELGKAGAVVARSNAQATELAILLVSRANSKHGGMSTD